MARIVRGDKASLCKHTINGEGPEKVILIADRLVPMVLLTDRNSIYICGQMRHSSIAV